MSLTLQQAHDRCTSSKTGSHAWPFSSVLIFKTVLSRFFPAIQLSVALRFSCTWLRSGSHPWGGFCVVGAATCYNQCMFLTPVKCPPISVNEFWLMSFFLPLKYYRIVEFLWLIHLQLTAIPFGLFGRLLAASCYFKNFKIKVLTERHL